jgi:hypothetical protein
MPLFSSCVHSCPGREERHRKQTAETASSSLSLR